MFTTPSEITAALAARIRARLLSQAYAQAEAAQELVGKKLHSRAKLGPLVAGQFQNYYGQTLQAANIDFRAIESILVASVKKATDLLEDRISRNIGEERLIQIQIKV